MSNPNQPESRYQPIWRELKERGKCRITAPPQYHKRIIRMVKKRRELDTEFLYSLAESHRKHTIRYKIEGSVITFTLTIELLLTGI